MLLADILLELTLAVTVMVASAALVIVGPRRLLEAVRGFRWRLRAILLPVAALVAVLMFRVITQDILPWLSWRLLGIRVTPHLYAFDRTLFGDDPVTRLQALQTPELTAYFVFIYIYGYVFLLVFPFIAYFALSRMDKLRTLILAYTANYAIGVVLYVLFVAYGPRNLDPAVFEPLLYDAFPQSRDLTNQVNQNVNVFPSLHTSLSMTALFLAWHTREEYPLWVPIAGVFAISVVLSTMYLGIHWFADVIAGTALAALSVYLGINYTVEDIISGGRRRLRALLERLRLS